MEQIYFSEASANGGYDVVRRNGEGYLEPIEHYLTEQEAIIRARELNEIIEEENRDFAGRW